MGCDIHGFIQVRDRPDGMWGTYAADPSIRRDYTLFLIMAGIRSHRWTESLPRCMFSPPRGLPEDVAEQLAAELKDQVAGSRPSWDMQLLMRWEGDGHSYSWLSYEELVETAGTYLRYKATRHLMSKGENPSDHLNPTVWLNTDLEAVLSYMAVYVSRGKQARIVFWFDN